MFKKKDKYQPPKKIKGWIKDDSDGDLHEVYISSDEKVWCTSGSFAHSSSSVSTSCAEFMAGELNDLVCKNMGQVVLDEVTNYLKQKNT